MTPDQDVIRRQTAVDRRRFDPSGQTATMKAVVTAGHGGPAVLEYRDVPIPTPGPGEVLLRVLAAGVNTTDVNTRLGWYSPDRAAGAERTVESDGGTGLAGAEGWNGATPFPLIQGADCCGRVVEVGPGGDPSVIGRRVLVRPCMRPRGFGSMETVWLGSDFDGAFAQFVRVPASEVFVVDCDSSDVELGAVPCVYGTAENMLRRAGVTAGEQVLVTGASGGVGSAAVQLARRRDAAVTAVAGRTKMDQMPAIGADRVVERDGDIVGALGPRSVDVVVDNVSGPALDTLLRVLRRGGRYVSSGAVAGPAVTLDKRTFYLNDLTLIGCTAWDEPVFPAVVAAVERGEARPLVAGTFPLERIAEAQRQLLERAHVGNFVLVPPPAES